MPRVSKQMRTDFGSFLVAATLMLTLAVLAACGTGGIEKPQSFEQQLAYAYSTHTAVLEAAANAVELDQLSIEDAQQVLRLSDESRVLLDASRAALGVGDVTTAQGQLTLATNILTQLKAYLNSRTQR